MIQKNIDGAFRKTTTGPLYKLVLVTLAMHADRSGRGSMAWADLLERTDLEMRRAKPALEALENFGFVNLSFSETEFTFRLRLDI